MNISNRLKLIISTSNINIKTFSELTGIPYRSLQNYLSGDRTIGVDALNKIHVQLNVNLNWLITGEGEMYTEKMPKEPPIEWLTEWLENTDEKNRNWLEIQMKRCFPEFEQWEKLKHQKMRD